MAKLFPHDYRDKNSEEIKRKNKHKDQVVEDDFNEGEMMDY